jgi:AraC-like DNA-binding protein
MALVKQYGKFMRAFFLFYYYLLANGLVLFFINYFRIKKNPATKYYFLQYLILLALVSELVLTEWVFRRFPFYCYPDFPVRFLITPFIYLYVCTYTNPQYKPSQKTKRLLFAPAVLELICFVAINAYYYRHPHSFEERLKIANNSIYYIIRTLLALVFNIACVYFAYARVSRFSWNIFKVLSNIKKLNFGWLKTILAISVFLWITWFIVFFAEIFFINTYPSAIQVMYLVLYLIIALTLLIFGYFAILKPYVPEAYIMASAEIDSINTPLAQDTVPAIQLTDPLESEMSPPGDAGIYKQYFIKLEDFMVSTQKFLDPDITLAEISRSLQTNSFNISKAIKLFSREGSFYEYINRYRLIYFLELLQKSGNDQYTLNALAMKAGFSSATTLNKYCKKITGHTPARAKTLMAEGWALADLLNT